MIVQTPSSLDPRSAAAIAAYRPRGISEAAAVFACRAVAEAAPASPARAKAFLFAAGRLAAFGESVGLELSAKTLLGEPVIERFIARGTHGLSPASVRTLRSNLRALAFALEEHPCPRPLPLPRERAKAPYSEAEIDGYLRLATCQPTEARRMRCAALICLGVGAGIIAGELRGVRGSDVICRSGGLIVRVSGTRSRVVPVLYRFHERLLAAAAFAGDGPICGGREESRKNITCALTAALSVDPSLPRLQSGRLRSTWLHEAARTIGLQGFMAAAGVVCSQRLGDIAAGLPQISETEMVAHLGGIGVSDVGDLSRLEAILHASGVPQRIEAMLPIGVRPRQLCVHTLLLGTLITLADDRPAHLRRIHRALISLSEAEKRRLGVIASFKSGPHLLTYRQVERTFRLISKALAKDHPDGRPSQALCLLTDSLIEASVQVLLGVPQSSSLALDWSDYESFARPPRKPRQKTETQQTAEPALPDTHAPKPEQQQCADPEAAWGHRKVNHPAKSESFFGYYVQGATIVKEEDQAQIPELTRRITLASCKHDPPAQIVPVLARMSKDGIPLGDLTVDSGYSYRQAETFALPTRAHGAKLVMDLHPNDRGINGTHQGAICANGKLYCPATPKALFELSPPAPAATQEELAAHDQKTAELSRYKLSPFSAPDQDGSQRVICPAVKGKLRCPLRPESMSLSHERPTITETPEHPPLCCEQKTITVPPSVNAKSAQKHDYPSRAFRHSYARRTASERTFSQVYDPASTDISRGWSRLMGLTPNTLLLSCAFIIANIRVADAFTARQAEDRRHAEHGLPPRHRRKRRKNLHEPTANANAPPAIAA